MSIQLEQSWKEVFVDEFEKGYMKNLLSYIQNEQKEGRTIFPPNRFIFNAFNYTPFNAVKVVILGQDPYHGQGQAHGLSFSVQKGVNTPPSLKNIFKELVDDIPGFRTPLHGDLTQWADQGVLLLNATLTVEANKPGSHQKKGWEIFTDKVIAELSARRMGVVFLLWGKFAQEKAVLIDKSKHHILTATHPSPYSAANGFFFCRHFSKTNQILQDNNLKPIDWQLD
jgi:uracil-DNA glycosylase